MTAMTATAATATVATQPNDGEGYLSFSENKWRTIFQGLQICNDKATPFEAMAAAEQMKVPLASCFWHGDKGAFVRLYPGIFNPEVIDANLR